jgi:hypothetical protein
MLSKVKDLKAIVEEGWSDTDNTREHKPSKSTPRGKL